MRIIFCEVCGGQTIARSNRQKFCDKHGAVADPTGYVRRRRQTDSIVRERDNASNRAWKRRARNNLASHYREKDNARCRVSYRKTRANAGSWEHELARNRARNNTPASRTWRRSYRVRNREWIAAQIRDYQRRNRKMLSDQDRERYALETLTVEEIAETVLAQLAIQSDDQTGE